jgi:predicted nucleic acid-binding Zn ribbon protein
MAKKKKKGVKYCPDCGSELSEKDKYCTKCGYSFDKRKKKNIKIKNLIILVVVVIIIWIAIRILSGNPIIPQLIIDIFTNNATKAAG